VSFIFNVLWNFLLIVDVLNLTLILHIEYMNINIFCDYDCLSGG